MGFELMTSSLPRMRSTPELHRLFFERGRRIELPFPAWKAGIIAIIRTPLFKGGRLCFRSNAWEEVDSNHRTRRSGFTVRRNCRYAILPDWCLILFRASFEPIGGFEPSTPRLQITCSGQLSYIGNISSLSCKRTAKIEIFSDSPKKIQSFSSQIVHPFRRWPTLLLCLHAV